MKLFISISTLAYPYPNVVRIYLGGRRGGELGEMRVIICYYSYTVLSTGRPASFPIIQKLPHLHSGSDSKNRLYCHWSFFSCVFHPFLNLSLSSSVADPGCLSRIRRFPSRIPDPYCLHPGSRIRIKEFKYFNPKKTKKKGCSSRIRMLTFYPSRIPDPGVKKAPDPGSATLLSSLYQCHWHFLSKILSFSFMQSTTFHKSYLRQLITVISRGIGPSSFLVKVTDLSQITMMNYINTKANVVI